MSTISIVILISMVVLGIALAAALYHIYQEPANPDGHGTISRGSMRKRPLVQPRG